MPLSLEKLENVLKKNGILRKETFSAGGAIRYIAIVLPNGHDALLSIPDTYTFPSPPDSYTMTPLQLSSQADVIEEYDTYDEFELEGKYGDTHDLGDGDVPIETNLERNYKRTISVNELTDARRRTLGGMTRMLNRLRYSLQHVRYELSLLHGDIFCQTEGDLQTPHRMFTIPRYPDTERYRIIVTINLELMFEHSSVLLRHVETIKKGLLQIMSRNRQSNMAFIQQIAKRQNLRNVILRVNQSLQHTQSTVDELMKLLGQAVTDEDAAARQVKHAIHTKSEGVTSDAQRVHAIQRAKKELEELRTAKLSILDAIIDASIERDHLVLVADKTLFDNAVMMRGVSENFKVLIKATQ